jgi:hypothetical protein
MLAIDDTLPQRPDEAEEARGLHDGPAGGCEFFRERILCHNISFVMAVFPMQGIFNLAVISSVAVVV